MSGYGHLFEEMKSCVDVQAMAVRGEETEAFDKGKDLDGSRKFQSKQILELDEGGMSELASACKAAGLEQLFLTAMKINK